MVWALALRVAWALTWWIVPLLWAVWCAVFWRPSLIAATLETVLAGAVPATLFSPANVCLHMLGSLHGKAFARISLDTMRKNGALV